MVGFSWSTLFVVVWNLLVFFVTLFFLMSSWCLARGSSDIEQSLYTRLGGNKKYGAIVAEEEGTESLQRIMESSRMFGEQKYQTL